MTDDHQTRPADDAQLDRAIRRTVAALAEVAPEPPPLPTPGVTPAPIPRHEPDRGRWLAVAAAVLLVVGGVGWWWAAGHRDPLQPVATEARPVAHQTIRWTQEVELTCEGGTGGGTTTIDLELWVDVAGERVRQQATYADGTVRDQVWEGAPDREGRKFERGSSSYVAPTCPRWGAVAVDDTPGLMGRLAGPGPDLIPGDSTDHRITVPGEHTDEIGRSAELQRAEWKGTAQPNDGVPTDVAPIHQTTDWYVEPGTGRLLQSTFRDEVEGVYTVTTTMVVLTDDEVAAVPGQFDTDGYELVYEASSPDPGYVTAEAVAPAVQVGADRYWPPDPAPGEVEATARRFAVEVLGWADPGVSGSPDSAEQGPQMIYVDDRRGHSVQLLVVPTTSGGWELLQINSGGASVSYDAEGNDKLGLSFPDGTAEVVIEAHLDPGGPRAWRATISESTVGVVLAGTSDDPMVRAIVFYRDAHGHTIGADSLSFGKLADPSTPPTEPTPTR